MSLQQDSEDEKKHEKLLKDISSLGSVTKKRFVTASSLKISLSMKSLCQHLMNPSSLKVTIGHSKTELKIQQNVWKF